MGGIVAAIVGFFWSAPKALYFLPFAIAACLIETRRRKLRLKALAASRAGDSICTFARSFDCRETDTWVIRAVYEQIQAHLASDAPAFPLHRDDHLIKELGIDPDDLSEDIAEEIAMRTGRSLEETGKNPFFEKVETVGDLVQFFLHQPRAAT
jgi:hypothetical protein